MKRSQESSRSVLTINSNDAEDIDISTSQKSVSV